MSTSDLPAHYSDGNAPHNNGQFIFVPSIYFKEQK